MMCLWEYRPHPQSCYNVSTSKSAIFCCTSSGSLLYHIHLSNRLFSCINSMLSSFLVVFLDSRLLLAWRQFHFGVIHMVFPSAVLMFPSSKVSTRIINCFWMDCFFSVACNWISAKPILLTFAYKLIVKSDGMISSSIDFINCSWLGLGTPLSARIALVLSSHLPKSRPSLSQTFFKAMYWSLKSYMSWNVSWYRYIIIWAIALFCLEMSPVYSMFLFTDSSPIVSPTI